MLLSEIPCSRRHHLVRLHEILHVALELELVVGRLHRRRHRDAARWQVGCQARAGQAAEAADVAAEELDAPPEAEAVAAGAETLPEPEGEDSEESSGKQEEKGKE